jgi:hypothetical protein
MTDLDRQALATTPLPKGAVAAIFGMTGIKDAGHAHIIKKLCLSHERLRMELEGAEKLSPRAGRVQVVEFVPDEQGGHIVFNGKVWRPTQEHQA